MNAVGEMQMHYIIILLVLAFIFRFVLKCINKEERDNLNPNQYVIDEGVTEDSLKKVPEWLKVHGTKQPGDVPLASSPLGKRATDVFREFSKCFTDKGTCIFDRLFLSRPYEYNSEYVRINDSPDIHILMKRNSSDDTIYNVDVDEGDYRTPAIYATSIDHYIVMTLLIEDEQISFTANHKKMI